MKPNVYIIVLTWNRKDLVLQCLTSLGKIQQKFISPHIIVVDNNSNDKTVLAVKKKFPKVTIIKNETNLGWSGGNNVGAKYALKKRADYIVFLNNDTVVTPTTIDTIIRKIGQNQKIGIVSPKIYLYGKKNILGNAGNFITPNYSCISIGAGKKDIGQYDKILETDFVAGTICVRKEVFKKIGFFDEKYFLYFEDADFCLRAKKAGFVSIFDQKTVLYHYDSGTIGTSSALHTYYNSRNHLLFVEKYAPFPIKALVLFETARILLRQYRKKLPMRKYYFLGVRDYFLRNFGKRNIQL